MFSVFIAGSITIRQLERRVQVRLMNILALDYKVLVGDAAGVDGAVQQFLREEGASKVVVYCTGKAPRTNRGGWAVHSVATGHVQGSRAYYQAKDVAMAQAASAGFMIWDGKSTGTLGNLLELLAWGKNSLVFLQKEKQFRKVCHVADLEALLGLMPDAARRHADAKLGLAARLQVLRTGHG